MGMFGADVVELRRLAVALRSHATEIDGQVAAPVTQLLRTSPWEGPDATNFRSDWDSRLSSSLRHAAVALREAGEILDRNADEQEKASISNGALSSTGQVDGQGSGSSSGYGTPTFGIAGSLVSEFGSSVSSGADLAQLTALGAAWTSPFISSLSTERSTDLATIAKSVDIADNLGRFDDLAAKAIKHADTLGKVAAGISFAGDFMQGYDHYTSSEGMGGVEAAARASAYSATKLAVNLAAAEGGKWVGAAIGTAVGGPLGGVIGGVLGSLLGPIIVDGVMGLAGDDQAYRAVSDFFVDGLVAAGSFVHTGLENIFSAWGS